MSSRQYAVTLTGRVREVLDLYAAGWSTRDIADELHIAPTTVHEYLARIRTTYGMKSRRDLVRLAQLTAKEKTHG